MFFISKDAPQLNGEIRDKELRVIADDGEQLGIMSAKEAQKLADSKGKDLVKIAPQAKPPVCKIMDYGKYRFEQSKREKEAKKNQRVIEIKEIRLSPNIDVHDFEEDGRLSNGHARTILPLSPALQEKAADAILKSDLSVRQTEALVKRIQAEDKPAKKATQPADAVDYTAEAQKSLARALGRGVKIVRGRKKGRIELEYYGLDDLNGLLDALAALRVEKKP